MASSLQAGRLHDAREAYSEALHLSPAAKDPGSEASKASSVARVGSLQEEETKSTSYVCSFFNNKASLYSCILPQTGLQAHSTKTTTATLT